MGSKPSANVSKIRNHVYRWTDTAYIEYFNKYKDKGYMKICQDSRYFKV